MEHSIDIDADRLDNIQQKIKQGIDSLPRLPSEPCIFRVHEGLRHVNKEAYTPGIVSIGPYHHRKDDKFLEMEEHKKRNLDLLLKRMNQSMDPYLEAMMRLEDRARNCYANPIGLDGDDFVIMMLLDGCFVIEFLRKNFLQICFHEDIPDEYGPILKERAMEVMEELKVEDDPIFQASWTKLQISRDLMLLENQLAFFVLSKLVDMTQIPNFQFPPLEVMVMAPILWLLPEISLNCSDPTTFDSNHFLDLMYNVCGPSSPREISSGSNDETCMKMPCVMELAEASVKFRVEEGDESRKVSMFDLSFEHGLLKIPKLHVTDVTDTIFRNIIAYEQHYSHAKHTFFTDYTYFMDLLINNEADVKKLRRREIIENMLGDDIDVTRMFNRLGDGRIISSNFYYSDLCKQLNTHCDKSWNKAMAKLRHSYFNSPWAGVSTMAAAFLLLLTLAQTLVAVIPVLAKL